MTDEKFDIIKMCESIWGVHPPRRTIVMPKKEDKDDVLCNKDNSSLVSSIVVNDSIGESK